jgi:outer membrane protein OmpA-like peptidoglycan-associated protein
VESIPGRHGFAWSQPGTTQLARQFDPPQGVADVKLRLVASLMIAALVAAAPAAVAQEPHKNPSTGGTTGLFTVPLAAVLGAGEFSVGAYYSAVAHEPGDSSVETFGIAGAFAFAAAEKLEVFVSFEPRIGVERDFLVEIEEGISSSLAPRLDNHPFAVDYWQSGIGDLRIGAKYKVAGDPEAYDGVAVLGIVKLPTSSTDDGIGTGKLDFSVGLSGSKEFNELIGLGGYAGGTLRSSPDEIEIGHSFDFGVGVQVPTRYWISAIVEITGQMTQEPDVATPTTEAVAAGADPIIGLAGLRVSHESGVAVDLAATRNLNFDDGDSDEPVRPDGWLAKVSYTNSRREPVVFVGAAPMDLPPVNRPPTLSCRAERTSVRVGESVRLFADVNDPDGDPVTVTWATQAGSINPQEGETVTWSSQGVRPGSGPVSARASDGYGGTADCTLDLTVTEPPPPAEPRILTFPCSEFPSGNTRIDNRCKAILDDVALQMRQNPSATAVITGHSDSAGSAEVNDRMSQERADNARTYLVDTHGIAVNRIETASAGSSQPIADNATAEGRLQNRRIVVVITIPAQ